MFDRFIVDPMGMKYFDYRGFGLLFDDSGVLGALYAAVRMNDSKKTVDGNKAVDGTLEDVRKHLRSSGYRTDKKLKTFYEWPGSPEGLFVWSLEGSEITIFPFGNNWIIKYSISDYYDKSYNSKSVAKHLFVDKLGLGEKDFKTIEDLAKILTG